MSSPTFLADSSFFDFALARSLLLVDAAASVTEVVSSTICAYMCLLLLYTLSLGLSAVPFTLFLTLAFLLSQPLMFFAIPFIYLPPAALPALPAFLLMTSSAYLMPLPLYGSGLLNALISAATCPTTCLSGPLIVTRVDFSTTAFTPLGSAYLTGCE